MESTAPTMKPRSRCRPVFRDVPTAISGARLPDGGGKPGVGDELSNVRRIPHPVFN